MRGRRRWRTVAVVALLAAGGAGCSSDAEAPPTTSTTTTTAVPLAEPATVLEPGAEPRRTLRTRYEVGTKATVRMVTDVVIDQEVEGQRQRFDNPPIAQVVRYEVVEVDGAEAVVALEVVDVSLAAEGTDLDEEQVRTMTAAIEPLRGLRGEVRVDDLGRVLDASLDVPEDLDATIAATLDSLSDQLSQLTPALPEEPVGVGGSWRSTATAGSSAAAGAGGTTTTTYVVTAIDGDRISYEAASTVTLPAQELEGDIELRSSEGTGTTTGWFDLSTPAFELEGRAEATQVLAMEVDGTEVTVRQDVTTILRAAPDAP